MNATAPAPRRSELRSGLIQALQLFGLCGLALAQPILDLLGKGPTFFVAHGVGRNKLLLFVAILLVVPPLLLSVLVAAITFVSKAAGRVAMATIVGVLVALAVVPPVDRRVDLPTVVFVLLFVAIALAAGLAYARLTAARTFTTYLIPAPAFFAALFLFASPASALVTSSDPAAISNAGGRSAPVVFLMLDELPLGALLDAHGNIDATRFPGFARLASVSTWYPDETTVAPWTQWAVPALLTGQYPKNVPPIASQFPHSLFTMLGNRSNVHVTESTTRLCPQSICGAGAPAGTPAKGLAKDTAVVALHQLLPQKLADHWLPAISGQWSGFGQQPQTVAMDGADSNPLGWQQRAHNDGERDQFGQFNAFVDSIGGTGNGELWYLHEMLPHMPWRFLPDGQTYSAGDPLPESVSTDWLHIDSDPNGTPVLRQHLMLQLSYVDHQINQLLDRLSSQNLLKKTMLVVTSDHGISLEPGGHRRAAEKLDAVNRNEVPPVPLFIKYPDQTTRAVDRRQAEIIDVLPTIADALHVNLPSDWHFDGVSLKAPEPKSRHRRWFDGSFKQHQLDAPTDPKQMAAAMQDLFGPGGGPHDLYAMGPYRDLVGRPVAGLTGAPESGASIRLPAASAYAHVDPSAHLVPALVDAKVSGIRSGTWVAITLNGKVAGIAPAFASRQGDTRVEMVLDPSLLVRGTNTMQAYVVGANGTTLRPLGAP